MAQDASREIATRTEAALVAALGRRSVVLVGMMGAGKSSIGRRLASRLGIPFIDADEEIEIAHAGMKIHEIFAEHGEPYFRAGEARVIARLLKGGPQVLATGGGAFMNPETRAAIGASGISIWLKADFEHHGTGKGELNVVDPAYDLAETILELALSPVEEASLIRRYIEDSGDAAVEERLFMNKLLAGLWTMESVQSSLFGQNG